jgi:hypothetical protein
MHANSNPGQFLMSYSKGFAGLSPKFATKEEIFPAILTTGKRQSTVGQIRIFVPAYLDLLVN